MSVHTVCTYVRYIDDGKLVGQDVDSSFFALRSAQLSWGKWL